MTMLIDLNIEKINYFYDTLDHKYRIYLLFGKQKILNIMKSNYYNVCLNGYSFYLSYNISQKYDEIEISDAFFNRLENVANPLEWHFKNIYIVGRHNKNNFSIYEG